jgi:hypothetical protein
MEEPFKPWLLVFLVRFLISPLELYLIRRLFIPFGVIVDFLDLSLE